MTVSAITFDFHNTLARCDSWFELEVRELVPTYLRWYARHTSASLSCATVIEGAAQYRRVRKCVLSSGIEIDALACLQIVTARLGYDIDDELLCRGLEAIMRATLADATPMPGALEAVRSLGGRERKLAVISSAIYHPFLEWTLESFEIYDAFDGIYSSANVGVYKSSPEIYTICARRLGVSPEETLHVGDSHEFDVITATMAGMKTALISADCSATSQPTADLVIPSLRDLAPSLSNGM